MFGQLNVQINLILSPFNIVLGNCIREGQASRKEVV